MKTLIKRNPVPGNIFGVLAMTLVSAPLIAGEREQAMEQLMHTWGQGLQEKVAIQIEQAVTADIVLQYENLLTQQTSDYTDELALAMSIESGPVISLEPESMMANIDGSVGVEIDCDD